MKKVLKPFASERDTKVAITNIPVSAAMVHPEMLSLASGDQLCLAPTGCSHVAPPFVPA